MKRGGYPTGARLHDSYLCAAAPAATVSYPPSDQSDTACWFTRLVPPCAFTPQLQQRIFENLTAQGSNTSFNQEAQQQTPIGDRQRYSRAEVQSGGGTVKYTVGRKVTEPVSGTVTRLSRPRAVSGGSRAEIVS